MKVRTTVTFSDEHRALIARFLGRTQGPATRFDCEAWVKSQTMASLAVLAEAERQKHARRQSTEGARA